MNRKLRNIAMGAAGAAAATAAYALFIEPRWLQCTRTTMHFAHLPKPLEGLRIALLTDLHASSDTPHGLIARAVRMAMRERPDMIAITGDIAANESMLEQTLDELAALRAPLGVYIVPGNHDYRDVGIERWHDAVSRRRSLTDLTNRARVVNIPAAFPRAAITMEQRVGRADAVDSTRLCIAGVDDLAEGRPRLDALHGRSARDFTILLAHNPDQAEQARRGMDKVDLMLSGHTHGGQVRLPGVGAIVNSAEHADLYEAGVRRRPWTQVYTSRGIGTVHLPVRFLTRPEMAIVTLTGAPRAGGPWQRLRRASGGRGPARAPRDYQPMS
ncbi:MAG TPA: metallophosphoesterase [Longimicrobiales bacterium]|nr:metallophosphoesterase [Longimicrobiales bacterium]